MTTLAAKRIRMAKRGGALVLLVTVLLFLIYLVLLWTNLLDSKHVCYPDLEPEPAEPSISIRAVMQTFPEWAAWEASKEQRAEALNEMRRGDATSPEADLADKLRPEVAMAIALAEQLVDRPEMLSLSPQRDPISFDETAEEARMLVSVSKGLAASLFLTKLTGGGQEQDPNLSALSLRLLAKSSVIGGQHVLGRLNWLNAEESSHRILVTDLHQAIIRGDRERCQALLSLLESCRTPGDKSMANALKGEFKSFCALLAYSRSMLGDHQTIDADGVPVPWKFHIECQWSVLRTQPNRCAALLANEYRIMIKAASARPSERVLPQQTYFPHFMTWRDVTTSLHPNGGGLYLLNIGHTSFEKQFQFEDLNFARHHLLRLLIALALYRMDHGNKFPADLTALAPGYLTDIPCDSYTGDPPIYDPEAGKLAFRGMDFVASPERVDGKWRRNINARVCLRAWPNCSNGTGGTTLAWT